MSNTPNKPNLIMFSDGMLGFDMPAPSPEEIVRRKWVSTKCGQVKRYLLRNERLTGKTLEFRLAYFLKIARLVRS